MLFDFYQFPKVIKPSSTDLRQGTSTLKQLSKILPEPEWRNERDGKKSEYAATRS